MMINCPHCNKLFIHIRHKVKGKTMRERFMQFVYMAPNGCWLWMGGLGDKGYPHFNHGGKTLYAHRVSLEIHLGRPIASGMEVLHSCPDGDNPLCVNPDHLREGTHAENMRDMFKRGRSRSWGENTRTAKLTESQVIEIRQRWKAGGIFQKDLAAEYGISQQVISKLVNGLYWKHLLPGADPRMSKNGISLALAKEAVS